jgi:hypothetical protein
MNMPPLLHSHLNLDVLVIRHDFQRQLELLSGLGTSTIQSDQKPAFNEQAEPKAGSQARVVRADQLIQMPTLSNSVMPM